MAEDVSCVDDKCARKLVLRILPELRHTEGLAVQVLFAYGMDRYTIEKRKQSKHHYEITKLQLMTCCNI